MNMSEENASYSPLRVSWKEVRDHLVTRLMIDDQWLMEESDRLMWWPTALPMVVQVLDQDEFPDSVENWLQVTGATLIAETDEATGRHLASEYACDFPVGAVVYSEGTVRLQTTFALNPRNRSLLPWFHQCLLIQAATALKLAEAWGRLPGVSLVMRPHPVSGERFDSDELVRIYEGSEFNFPVDEESMERFGRIREQVRKAILDCEPWRPGFSSDEVDFFNFGFDSDDLSGPLDNGAFDFAIGLMPGSELDRQLGPSLRIVARILPLGVAFDAEQMSLVNEVLCELSNIGVFGYVTGPESSEGGSCMLATVPHLTLAEWARLPPDAFATTVLNSIWHVTAAAQRLRSDVLGIAWATGGGL